MSATRCDAATGDGVPSLHLVRIYLAVVLALTILLFALPQWQVLWVGLVGVAALTAMVVGILRHLPGRRLPWWLLTGSMLAGTAGITWWRWQLTQGSIPVSPSWTDVALLLIGLPLVMAGLTGLIRAGLLDHDRGGLLDTLILTAGTGLLAWTMLIAPFVQLPGLTLVQRVLAVTYPVAGVLVLGTIVRLAGITRRNPAAMLLVLGGFAQLATGAVFGLGELGLGIPAMELGSLFVIGYYAAWGAAALHPQMRELTEARPIAPGGLGRFRLLALVAAALFAPAVLALQVVTGQVRDVVVAGVLTGVIVLLAFVRILGGMAAYRQVVARERALRRAGTALAAATTAEEISDAVAAVVAQLLPPDTPHRVFVSGETDRECSAADDILAPDAIDPAVVRQLGQPEAVLCHRLAVVDQEGSEVLVGVMCIGGPPYELGALQATTGVLASQAALALERVRLTAEVQQRASEEYFRTLVQNASDMIIILGEGGHRPARQPIGRPGHGEGWT